jgi:uncharacterized protein YjdB
MSFVAMSMFFSCGSEEPEKPGEPTDKPQEHEQVSVTGISLDPKTLVLEEGQLSTLTATVVPENATNPKVLWTSGDDKVATVADGLVKAVKAGNTAITATTEDGGKTAICMVTVKARIIPTVTISKTSLDLTEGDMETLTATVGPEELSDKTVTWTSSDVNVAVVDNAGRVIAVDAGVTTVKASANGGGGVSASCTVTVRKGVISPTIVDLGLSVYWATCNLGAASPEEYGDYYAWGETETKQNYSWETYLWCNGSYNTLSKYNNYSSYGIVDNIVQLQPDDDVAHVKLGGNWRIPTNDECEELTYQCTWQWTSLNGVIGYKVTGRTGNSIFIPAAGYKSGTNLANAGIRGDYWSSVQVDGIPYQACNLDFDKSGFYRHFDDERYYGRSVRPVTSNPVVPVTSITMNRNTLYLVKGSSAVLTAQVRPDNATDKTITWTSSVPSVATVSQEGSVTAERAGSAIITASAGNKTATCIVTVSDNAIGVTSVTLNKNAMSLVSGSFESLTVTVNPANATNVVTAWTSSDGSVATVDNYGMVKAKNPGKSTVTVTAGGRSASCVVTVKSKDVNPGGIEGTVEEGLD